jgi:hypothetical protein
MSKRCYRGMVMFFGIVMTACGRGAQSSDELLPQARAPVSQSPASQPTRFQWKLYGTPGSDPRRQRA